MCAEISALPCPREIPFSLEMRGWRRENKMHRLSYFGSKPSTARSLIAVCARKIRCRRLDVYFICGWDEHRIRREAKCCSTKRYMFTKGTVQRRIGKNDFVQLTESAAQKADTTAQTGISCCTKQRLLVCKEAFIFLQRGRRAYLAIVGYYDC